MDQGTLGKIGGKVDETSTNGKVKANSPGQDPAAAEIRNAIDSGDYEIDSAAIADAMIRLDRSFGE